MTLCLSEAQYLKAVNQLKVPYPNRWLDDESTACVHHLKKSDNCSCCIVCLRIVEGQDPVEVAGTLVHEAVHVWQRYKEIIGEAGSAGKEIEAFAIETISVRLMASYRKQIGEVK